MAMVPGGLFVDTLRGRQVTTVRGPKTRSIKKIKQKKAFHQITDRNRQIGSKDSALQICAINKVWEDQQGGLPKRARGCRVLLRELNNRFGRNPEQMLLQQLSETPLEVGDLGPDVNPNYAFTKVSTGASGTTYITGDFVLKGYDSLASAEIEWVCTKFMDRTGEKVPDMVMASPNLREKILKRNSAYKQQDEIIETLNREFLTNNLPLSSKRTIKKSDPQHILMMPRLNASNLLDIIEDPVLRQSFKRFLRTHIEELARIAFKDLVLGNGDRCVQLYMDSKNPPYLRDFPSINRGNVMFQTVSGRVLPKTAVAIDTTNFTDNDLCTEEGVKQELMAFRYHMTSTGHEQIVRHMAAALRTQLDSETPTSSEKTDASSSLQRLSNSVQVTEKRVREPLIELSDDELQDVIRTGFLKGREEVLSQVYRLNSLLSRVEHQVTTLEAKAYIKVVQKKLSHLSQRTSVSYQKRRLSSTKRSPRVTRSYALRPTL